MSVFFCNFDFQISFSGNIQYSIITGVFCSEISHDTGYSRPRKSCFYELLCSLNVLCRWLHNTVFENCYKLKTEKQPGRQS